jgi:hypothetical protein
MTGLSPSLPDIDPGIAPDRRDGTISASPSRLEDRRRAGARNAEAGRDADRFTVGSGPLVFRTGKGGTT